MNNAGVVSGRALLDTPDHLIERSFNVNVLAHFWVRKYANLFDFEPWQAVSLPGEECGSTLSEMNRQLSFNKTLKQITFEAQLRLIHVFENECYYAKTNLKNCATERRKWNRPTRFAEASASWLICSSLLKEAAQHSLVQCTEVWTTGPLKQRTK